MSFRLPKSHKFIVFLLQYHGSQLMGESQKTIYHLPKQGAKAPLTLN